MDGADEKPNNRGAGFTSWWLKFDFLVISSLLRLAPMSNVVWIQCMPHSRSRQSKPKWVHSVAYVSMIFFASMFYSNHKMWIKVFISSIQEGCQATYLLSSLDSQRRLGPMHHMHKASKAISCPHTRDSKTSSSSFHHQQDSIAKDSKQDSIAKDSKKNWNWICTIKLLLNCSSCWEWWDYW